MSNATNTNNPSQIYDAYYFLGIGGIGMSNLARYFLSQGKRVGGYDRTATDLTRKLEAEGAWVHYQDDISAVPTYLKQKESTLVVFTPAIPSDHSELNYFKNSGFRMVKRSEALGEITRQGKALCCAGTHGKTTTSSMLAHILRQSHLGCNAFLGGILKNYDTNLLLDENSPFTVVEADEYDRSFHRLHPYMALITSTDPDHLDIYGTEEAYLQSFAHFTSLIAPDGALVMKKGMKLRPETQQGVAVYTYSESEGDFHAENIRIGGGTILFDFVTPTHRVSDVELGVPLRINIENAVGAMALAWLNGATDNELKRAIATFQGAQRRFDFRLKTSEMVFIDDYAHHPEELSASISSVRALYPHRKITGVFQPHLYSRTNDFAPEFAQSLSQLDELILLDIYPARELPIPGVTSELIFKDVRLQNKVLIPKKKLIDELSGRNIDVLLTLGAGDIDALLPDIDKLLSRKNEAK